MRSFRILLALALLLTLPSAGFAVPADGADCPARAVHGEADHGTMPHADHGGPSPTHDDCGHGSDCQCEPMACPAGGAQAAASLAAPQIESSSRTAPRPAAAGFVPFPPPERSLRPPISV